MDNKSISLLRYVFGVLSKLRCRANHSTQGSFRLLPSPRLENAHRACHLTRLSVHSCFNHVSAPSSGRDFAEYMHTTERVRASLAADIRMQWLIPLPKH
ncbi:unnamed protein product [Alternaria burnsii]|nr:unnamed protein product [Alternaria burnsii]